ncbi:hypothetical protein [Marinobacter manganoxydans]|uniref:Uncharacterized protein n=1 Tax=Marinobacter manganoxydans MnI7-9 TaxID=1094979 RepID=G6YV05_9GAMM|nr:hypothetical protein [Marinobacter manganoxydans]EHJ03939.1 hypothetical protein KYE_13500 [Marinobacter manganoxydans MnI7-9]
MKEKGSCPKCGEITPNKGNRLCATCYWIPRAQHSAKLQLARLEQPWVQELWRAFEIWLLRNFSPYNAWKWMFPSGDAFAEFDERFCSAQDMTTESVLAIGGPEWLRKHGYVSRFLAHTKIVDITDRERNEWAELRRIQDILDASTGENRQILNAFINYCRRGKGIQSKTLRVYLKAGQSFLQSTKSPICEVSEKTIYNFLRRHPGHRSSLFRFVTFLREAGYAPEAAVPKRPKKYRSGYSARVIGRIEAFSKEFDATGSIPRKRALCAAAIAEMLGVPLEYCLRLHRQDINLEVQSCEVRVQEDWYSCAMVIDRLIREVAKIDIGDDRLFPGKLPSDTLSAVGAAYHVKIALKNVI